jgi:hypothetical protein
MKTLARPQDKAELLRRLGSVRPGSARRWGRMTPHQMVCHVADSLRMCMGETPASGRGGIVHRTVVKWIVLYAPLRWPRGILTSPEIDQELAGTRPGDFAADVARVEALVELVTTQRGRADWPLHPVLGRMSGAAWLRWGYLHMDHHLRQFGA